MRATLLEHPRERAFGTRVAAIRAAVGTRARRARPRARGRARALARAAAARQPSSPSAGGSRALGPFDAHERRRNAHALLRAEAIAATGRRRGGLLGALDGVRTRTERALTAGLPPPQGALARGMVLGQDGALTERVREDFRVTGLAHLVAASGANVLLLATLVLAIATALGLGLSARLWLAIALVAAYVPLAGAGPSIQRAGVMGAAGLVAALAGRPVVALVRAAARRRAHARPQPSRGSRSRLAAELRRRARDARARPVAVRPAARAARVPRGLAEALAVTVAATLGTAPLIALHFERLSLVSLPVNVLAAPAVAPVMWLGTIAGALGQLAPWLAAPVAQLAALPLGYLTWLAERGAALPFAELAVGSPGPRGVAGDLRRRRRWRRSRGGASARAARRVRAPRRARAAARCAGPARVVLAAAALGAPSLGGAHRRTRRAT